MLFNILFETLKLVSHQTTKALHVSSAAFIQTKLHRKKNTTQYYYGYPNTHIASTVL